MPERKIPQGVAARGDPDYFRYGRVIARFAPGEMPSFTDMIVPLPPERLRQSTRRVALAADSEEWSAEVKRTFGIIAAVMAGHAKSSGDWDEAIRSALTELGDGIAAGPPRGVKRTRLLQRRHDASFLFRMAPALRFNLDGSSELMEVLPPRTIAEAARRLLAFKKCGTMSDARRRAREAAKLLGLDLPDGRTIRRSNAL